MKKNITSLIFLTFCILITLNSCVKEKVKSGDGEDNADKSIAGQIAGVFSGDGKYMRGQINLGSSTGCNLPAGWEDNFQTGSAAVDIIKIDDSTVKITVASGPFPKTTYDKVRLSSDGASIDFYYGTYDISSKFLLLSAYTNNSIYATTDACLTGLPYLYGSDLLGTGSYFFQTIDHIDFTGSK